MFFQEPLYQIPDGVETKWVSPENARAEKGMGGMARNGRKGMAHVPLAAGADIVLAEQQGKSGMVRRIWATISDRSPEMLRGLRIAMYWDGAASPAVDVPFGDFFGMGLGLMATFESAFLSSPEGRSFNCILPMPFRSGMKIVLTNTTERELASLYYDVDYTLGDSIDADALYLHARFNRQNPTALRQDFEILPKVSGKGRFLGCNIGVAADMGHNFHAWWGEGEVKMYLDGDDTNPSLCGTGAEDYIGTGWTQGAFNHMYQGCTVADRQNMQYCFYRYHIPDPVYFRKDIRVAIQQLGCWDPDAKPLFTHSGNRYISADGQEVDFSKDGGSADYGLFERQDDWSCCSYFYLDRPNGE